MEKGTAQGGARHDPESGVVLPAGEELKAELKGTDNRVIPGARVLEWHVASVEVGKGAKSKLLLQGIGKWIKTLLLHSHPCGASLNTWGLTTHVSILAAGKAKSGQLIALLGPSGENRSSSADSGPIVLKELW